MPSRILEIGEGEQHDQAVYLRSREDLTPQPYMTLSHCWGGTTPMRLTKESEEALKAGISVNSLPKTFRDAIYVVGEFGASHIWIDSLCILQDNLQDWEDEAGVMCDVYSNAICNIAATGARDGSIGLFFERDTVVECPFYTTPELELQIGWDGRVLSSPQGTLMVYPRDQWERDVEHAPLNRRAWVMQERFLSTRVLHFSDSQVFWECPKNTASEVFPDEIPITGRPIWYFDSHQLKRVFFQAGREDGWADRVYFWWQVFVRGYSRCGLSKDDDKLVAIHGIGKVISRAIGDELVGGLWQKRLIQELCWRRHLGYEEKETYTSLYPSHWRAPSWSWASTNVAMHPSNMRHHERCANLRRNATVEAIDVVANGSGQLERAVLRIRGKLINGSKWDNVKLDCPSLDPESTDGIFCLVMISCSCNVLPLREDETEPSWFCEGLALRVIDGDRYERIGVVEVSPRPGIISPENEAEGQQIITIV
ncbi:HET-domain-containing protein [Microthyrium microscopicum]|uniref:HET-domain-containing protein n=1 Tax=Microthyrium microscopicum TaxID=703497 RepID=A0A6A6UCE3_9PEZI|nr:HET-domain-containing protein [Microthyrium microscopicum]